MKRHLEDYAVGQTYGSGRIRVDGTRIKAFATEFDPQQFQMDEASAAGTIFRGLTASGCHTAAITMRLMVDGRPHIQGLALNMQSSPGRTGRGQRNSSIPVPTMPPAGLRSPLDPLWVEELPAGDRWTAH